MFTASPSRADPTVDNRKTPSAMAMQALVDTIFERFSATGIPYCLLRNRSAIPERLLAWSDIDVLIPSTVTNAELIRLFAPFRPANIITSHPGHVSFFLPINGMFLRVDVFMGMLDWKGMPFIDAEEILAQRRMDRGYMVAAPIHQAFVVWFSKLLWKGHVPDRYESFIAQAVREEPIAFHRLARRPFGEPMANRLLEVAQGGAVAGSNALADPCRRALMRESLKRHPARTLISLSNNARYGLRRLRSPSGLDVALLGPDGVGKSSLATHISTSPSRMVAMGTVEHQRSYHPVLPRLSLMARRLSRRPLPARSNPLDPHGNPPLHPLVWLIRYGYYTVDQWLAYIRLRHAIMHPHMVIKDRHWIEIGIDPKRYRYEGPPMLPRVLSRLVPEPSVVIVLDAPTDVIHARKQELTAEDIETLRIAYRQFLGRTRNRHLVNANQPHDDVAADVLGIVNGAVRERTLRRFPNAGC